MQIVLYSLVLAGLISAFRLPYFRGPEGYFEANVILLFSLSVAILLLAITWRNAWRRAAGWFSLFIFGQGIILQLINAGPTVHYQHYAIAQGVISFADGILFVGLLVQGILVFTALRSRIGQILFWIRTNLGWRGWLLLAAFIVLGVFPSRELPMYGLELVLAACIGLIQLACLLLGVMSIPGGDLSTWSGRVNAFLEGTHTGTGMFRTNIDRLAITCAVWVFLVVTILAILSYERHPHVPDEFAYLFHANYFAHGQLSVPAPPVPEAVEAYLMDCNQERCISPVPPGWPAMLALGSYAGVPWLVNPVLSAINVIILFLLLRHLYDRKTARLGVLLLSASPWYLLVSMSFMTHTFSLMCALLAALSVVQLYRKKSWGWAVIGGSAIGVLSLNRPLEGLMVACTLGLAALFIPGRRFRFGPVVTLGLFTLLIGALVFPYNKAMTGNPLSFPIMVYADRVLGPGVNALGFGADKGAHWGGLDPFPGHGLPDVIVNALLNTSAMNIEMFGWSTGSLLLIMLFLAVRSPNKFAFADRWMLFFVFVIFAFQSLYWFSGGPDFGARYYYLAVIPLIALTSRSVLFLGKTVSRSAITGEKGVSAVFIAVLVLSISALVNFVPWRAIDKYHHYRGMRPDMRTLLAQHDFSDSVILVNGKDHPDLNSALVYSDIDPYGEGPVIVWNRNAGVRKKLLEAYSDRKIWIVDGPTRTGKGYRLVAGPMKVAEAEQLLK